MSLLQPDDAQYAFDQESRRGILDRTAISARFVKKAVYDKDASEGFVDIQWDAERRRDVRVRVPGAGRPVYKEEIFTELGIPGNTLEMRCRPLRESDKQRFAPEWAAFEKGEAAPSIGTPLEEIPFLTSVQRAEFRHLGIKTAEQFAAISDGDGAKVTMGFQQIRQRVRDFLAVAAGEAPVNAMRAELESRDAEIADLKKQFAELSARLPKVEAAQVEEVEEQ